MNRIPESELVLNPDGSVYHLRLKPEHIADDVIVVGDQDRVAMISDHFDSIECRIQHREFITHTGSYKGKRVTVISTGIGTDNIDIVLNELDAAVNIDLEKRIPKENSRKLNIVRIGTSGSLQEDMEVDSFIMSRYGMGFDGLLNFYGVEKVTESDIEKAFIAHSNWPSRLNHPYVIKGSSYLEDKLGFDMKKGITATASGFYAPQGRVLRLKPFLKDINLMLTGFNYKNERITNFEMETSALFGLSKLLGHEATTICVIVANRIKKEFSKDYKKSVNALVETVLDRL